MNTNIGLKLDIFIMKSWFSTYRNKYVCKNTYVCIYRDIYKCKFYTYYICLLYRHKCIHVYMCNREREREKEKNWEKETETGAENECLREWHSNGNSTLSAQNMVLNNHCPLKRNKFPWRYHWFQGWCRKIIRWFWNMSCQKAGKCLKGQIVDSLSIEIINGLSRL